MHFSTRGKTQHNRVENEVAVMYLACKGLPSFEPVVVSTVPAVYTLQPAQPSSAGSDNSLGWILREFKPVLEQLAGIFSGIQRAPLPDSLNQYGNITIEDDKLAYGQMATLSGGSWKSYGDFWSTRLSSQLGHSKGSPALQG
ncbi:phosphotransferase enzyme family protein [Colletotrichum tofieldiae]|uniref:Phosphotransferase enzyme family protein n=1 Tax=Colletotrichum tofieldiae TaxID=708197 RepID=A0A166MLI6_9PEZI|nr:phosphotransferase enzyme family protein [Colletotrichum tofieldiae]